MVKGIGDNICGICCVPRRHKIDDRVLELVDTVRLRAERCDMQAPYCGGPGLIANC